MQVPAPFDYERASSIDHAVALVGAAWSRSPASRRRPLPAADDEAAPGPARGTHRHQRCARSVRDPPGRGRAADRRAGAPRPAARLAAGRSALPDLRRRRARHRRPDRAQPGHRGRLALPGRPQRRPLRGVRSGAGIDRHPRAPGRAGRPRDRLPHRPVRDGGRPCGDPHRGPHPHPSRRRQRLREGRAPRR